MRSGFPTNPLHIVAHLGLPINPLPTVVHFALLQSGFICSGSQNASCLTALGRAQAILVCCIMLLKLVGSFDGGIPCVNVRKRTCVSLCVCQRVVACTTWPKKKIPPGLDSRIYPVSIRRTKNRSSFLPDLSPVTGQSG